MIEITRQEVVNLINFCEKNGEFDKHVDPIDWDKALPVDGSFNYLRKGIRQFLQHTFIVKPFTNKVAKKDFLVEVKGKENLKGIKNAIVTCNHINKFDCLLLQSMDLKAINSALLPGTLTTKKAGLAR